MGGMIAQILAIRHPQRLLSLVSIYSTTGNPDLPQPQPAALEALLTPQPVERRAYIDFNVVTMQTIAGAGFAFDEQFIRNISARAYDRAFYPPGVGRQMMAVMTQENRTSALGSVTVPTLVIHGTADLLVPAAHGKETAAAIPGAQLLLVEGMGHDLPHTKGPSRRLPTLSRATPGLFKESWNAGKPGSRGEQSGQHRYLLHPVALTLPGLQALDRYLFTISP